VIYHAVDAELFAPFFVVFIRRFATHELMSDRSHKVFRGAERAFVAGYNLLPPHPGQWRLTLSDAMFCDQVVVVGAGWQHDTPPLTGEDRRIMRRSFARYGLHTVRDELAARHLTSIGIGAVNTSCPRCGDLMRRRRRVSPRAALAWPRLRELFMFRRRNGMPAQRSASA
jgi:hypothetical protein